MTRDTMKGGGWDIPTKHKPEATIFKADHPDPVTALALGESDPICTMESKPVTF